MLTAESRGRSFLRATVRRTRDLHHNLFPAGVLAEKVGDVVRLTPDRQPDLDHTFGASVELEPIASRTGRST